MKPYKIETEVLPLRLKFQMPKTNTNRIGAEAQFNHLFDQLQDLHSINEEKKGWFKSTLVDISNQYCISSTSKSDIISKEHLSDLKNTRQNDLTNRLVFGCRPNEHS